MLLGLFTHNARFRLVSNDGCLRKGTGQHLVDVPATSIKFAADPGEEQYHI
jgi:hypothetical protein